MKLNTNLIIAIIAGVLLVGGGGYYVYSQSQKTQSPQTPQTTDTQGAQKLAQAEVKKLTAEVGKLMELPTGEDPTVATITDITKLASQPFFQKGKNGDKVLIYSGARKAILYDPVNKKVIDVAPINIGTQSAQVAQPKIALRNGTGTATLNAKVETDLKKLVPQINIVSKDTSQNSNYEKTIVVVLNDNNKEAGAAVAKIFNTVVSNLPVNETKPKDADILVILGKDQI